MVGLTAEDFERLQAEVMILIKAYDDTFSQTVLARYSYRYDEIVGTTASRRPSRWIRRATWCWNCRRWGRSAIPFRERVIIQ